MTTEELEKWMEISAEWLALEVPEMCRPGVIENLHRNFAIAEVLLRVALPDEAEVAPIFYA